ncbi:MAG: DUF3953 domain-containing protein [Candidatus Aadella gelida]|nr:DUF3953 domain-containing protein [Candidatus Aadella gelida]
MWFLIIGVISLILGFLYSFKPSTIERFNKIGMKIVMNPIKFVEKRKLVGIFYFLAGIFLLSIAIMK